MWCWQLPHAAFQVAWAACPPLAAQLTAAAEAGQDVWTVVDSVANLPAVDVLASCLIAAAHSQPDSRFAASFADGAEHPLCVIAALLPRLFAGTYGGGMPLSQRRHYDNTLEHMLNALDLLYCPARGLDHEMAGEGGWGRGQGTRVPHFCARRCALPRLAVPVPAGLSCLALRTACLPACQRDASRWPAQGHEPWLMADALAGYAATSEVLCCLLVVTQAKTRPSLIPRAFSG